MSCNLALPAVHPSMPRVLACHRTTPARWTGLASSTGLLGEGLRRLDRVEDF